MTRKWFSYLLLILAISLLSCTKGLDFSRPYIELTVISDDSPDTKAPADGIDIDYQQGNYMLVHENKIETVDFFFYPGGDTEHDATYHKRVTSDKNKSEVFRMDLGADIINAKSRTHYGIATCVSYLADAVLNQRPTIASVCSVLRGEHGVRDVALSVPSVVGPAGVEQRIRERWDPEEYRGFFDAVEREREALAQLEETQN